MSIQDIVVGSITCDINTCIRRIEFELGAHVNFSRAQQLLMQARLELEQAPECPIPGQQQ